MEQARQRGSHDERVDLEAEIRYPSSAYVDLHDHLLSGHARKLTMIGLQPLASSSESAALIMSININARLERFGRREPLLTQARDGFA